MIMLILVVMSLPLLLLLLITLSVMITSITLCIEMGSSSVSSIRDEGQRYDTNS